ncbi:hypothetical protein BBO99_00004351 [Phytophthora kernoviae]|uniref:Uncharacterized protein n=2 Tax=Phytophthora kernoviae TaxID=325452 RepID=A0A3R7JUW7_9STRA|nr:hypothetical protein G195_003084 [Phytophthora kernoviae 00238/432]KAG2527749.1 hypothetical protein JM18_002289 [Phytophthora kernoviae]RLN10959.1 hypothetical protein BBI17_000781 [Phytophthora kernoviae]RLN80651.1 hypothetical protein BBO99_00004351 [Phytophthora kernoviae]
MESSQMQVNDLHKKFEDLNEEISDALRVQQDAVAGMSTASSHSNKQLKTFLEKNAKKEKMGSKQEQSALILELFEMRRDIMSRISEDLVKEKKQLDVEVGNPEALTTIDVFGDGGAMVFVLVFYVILMQALQDLQKEKRERLVAKSRNPVVAMTAVPDSNGSAVKVTESRAVSPTKSNNKETAPTLGDDVHFSYQKLKREVADLKSINAKHMLTNSQLEDDLAHLQAKFEEEKRVHLNGKKWFMPKIQKLEDVVLTTSKAFEEVKLSVELMANMYKERDHVSLLLSEEIKKIAALTKENERKDRLVTLAMAARYEMLQLANQQEQMAKTAKEELHRQETRSLQAEAEATTLKRQLEDTSARLEATDVALSSAKESIVQLQGEVQATVQAAAAKEAELLVAFEKQQAAMQQKLDKTKRELMEAVSEMLSLDDRLRKAQEKLAEGGQ